MEVQYEVSNLSSKIWQDSIERCIVVGMRFDKEDDRRMHGTQKASSYIPCRSAKGFDCIFPIWFTQCDRVWFTHAKPFLCHATTMPFWKRPLKARAWRGMGTAWYVWISIGRPETPCGRPARVRLLPATTQSSTKVVARSRPIVLIFPSATRNFAKDTALSENGRVAAWHV
jgi:hypothetical protein